MRQPDKAELLAVALVVDFDGEAALAARQRGLLYAAARPLDITKLHLSQAVRAPEVRPSPCLKGRAAV
jgi:hypothetical protein